MSYEVRIGPYNVPYENKDQIHFTYEALMKHMDREFFVTSERPDPESGKVRNIDLTKVCGIVKLKRYHKTDEGLFLIGDIRPAVPKGDLIKDSIHEDVFLSFRGECKKRLTKNKETGELYSEVTKIIAFDLEPIDKKPTPILGNK